MFTISREAVGDRVIQCVEDSRKAFPHIVWLLGIHRRQHDYLTGIGYQCKTWAKDALRSQSRRDGAQYSADMFFKQRCILDTVLTRFRLFESLRSICRLIILFHTRPWCVVAEELRPHSPRSPHPCRANRCKIMLCIMLSPRPLHNSPTSPVLHVPRSVA